MFSYISKNWEGKPLVDIVTIVKLIGSTTTQTGLKVICNVDEKIADVIHHCMYDLSKMVKEEDQARFEKLCVEFGH